jgi:hypothetical protein
LYPHLSAPIFAAVYGDHICRYGINCNPIEGEVFFIGAASLFCEGAKIGRLHATPGNRPSRPELQEQIAFLNQIIGYYRQPAARDSLCYGRLVRPIRFEQPDPMPLTDCVAPRARNYQEGKIHLPVLQTGAFVSPAGEVGIFLANAGPEDLEFRAFAPMEDYRLADGVEYGVEQVAADGAATPVGTWTAAELELTGTLPGRAIAMYRITPR